MCKSLFKRSVAFLLVFALIMGSAVLPGHSGFLSLVPESLAGSNGEWVYLIGGVDDDFNGEGIALINYKGTATDVVIPETVNGYTVTYIDDFIFSNSTGIKTITIPASVTRMSSQATYECPDLTAIIVDSKSKSYCSDDGVLYTKDMKTLVAFPRKKTSLSVPNSVATIGVAAFMRCGALKEVTIPNSVTSIEYRAFEGCTGLKTITLPNVKNIDSDAFSDCTGLETVTFGSGVTSIKYAAFSGCTNLTSAILPGNVTDFGSIVFYECPNLTIYCNPGSSAEAYAVKYKIPVQYINAITNYTVTFNKNASDAKGSMAKQTFTKDISQTLSANKFTRAGYAFTGWATSKTGKVTYKNKASFKTAKNVTLYAVWAKNYTVTFNKNASDAKGSMAKQTFAKDISKNLFVNKFTRTGYTFTGWATSKTGKVTYKDKAGFKTAKNITLYAVWKKGTAPAKMTAADFKATGADAAYIQNDYIKYMTSAITQGGWDPEYAWGYNPFYKGDSDTAQTVLKTNRGIKPGYSSWKDVEKAYGGTKKTWKKDSDLIYKEAFPTASTAFAEKWNVSKTYADYDYGRYRLRFYFDAKDNVVMVVYTYNYSLIGTRA